MSSDGRKTILIIDDDEILTEALNLLLEGEGYEMHCLTNGHNIDAWLDTHHVDIILIDYLMPGETGAEITRKLRERKDTKEIPIIMLAASPHYRDPGLEAGVDKFIVKPFEVDYLLRQIHSFLD